MQYGQHISSGSHSQHVSKYGSGPVDFASAIDDFDGIDEPQGPRSFSRAAHHESKSARTGVSPMSVVGLLLGLCGLAIPGLVLSILGLRRTLQMRWGGEEPSSLAMALCVVALCVCAVALIVQAVVLVLGIGAIDDMQARYDAALASES